MLVLSRATNERIMIGSDVTITVVEIRGGKVRLGIEAPKATPVYREEIQRRRERDAGNETSRPEQPGEAAGRVGATGHHGNGTR